jgi:hypothetical protein
MRQQRMGTGGRGVEGDKKSSTIASSLAGRLAKIRGEEEDASVEIDIPNPLQRIHSRRVAVKTGRQKTRTVEAVEEEDRW